MSQRVFKASIIIPVFNRAESLSRAVESLDSNHNPIEIVIIDDFSTDLTLDFARSLRSKNGKITVLRNSRKKGAQGARNTGILHSNSDLIIFLDSDDTYFPGAIDRLILEWEETKDANSWIISKRENRHVDGNVFLFETLPLDQNVFANPVPGFGGWVVPRINLIQIGLLNEDCKAYQEWDTAIRLAKLFPVTFSQSLTYVWNFGSREAISKDLKLAQRQYLLICLRYWKSIVSRAGIFHLIRNLAIGVFKFQK